MSSTHECHSMENLPLIYSFYGRHRCHCYEHTIVYTACIFILRWLIVDGGVVWRKCKNDSQ